MNPEDSKQFTDAVGQVVGETLFAFSEVIKALRRQPGFDDGAFCAELTRLMESNPTMLQHHAYSMILKEDGDVPADAV